MKTSKLVRTPLDALTYKINGLAMDVHNELKPGHREEMYKRRLFQKMVESGLSVEGEKRVEVIANGALIGYLFIDLWVEHELVVECKALSHQVTNAEIGQVITYLASTGSKLGLLLNFGMARLENRRIFAPSKVQDWQKHLYRSIWIPKGHSLPSRDLVEGTAPIHFTISNLTTAGKESFVSIAEQESHLTPVSESGSATQRNPSVSNPLSTYASAGVNIDAGNRAVDLMRDAVRTTYDARVLAGIGAFGGLFDASELKTLARPVLVASTDGVGTKVKLAAQAGRFDSIGFDIVNHCVNDILVQGARPLFFLDYLASSRLEPEMMATIVTGMAAACREAGCALLGGETAEMPGVYAPGEFDVAGTIIGVVDRAAILPRADIVAGDVLIGLRSSGPHTNGYSLIRKIFEGVALDRVFPELGVPLADALLAPHRSYLPLLNDTSRTSPLPIKALAHLTGGAFVENIPRVLPDGFGAAVQMDSWPVPPLFRLIQERGEIPNAEVVRVFNLGIGMVAIVAAADATAFQNALGEESWRIGEVVQSEQRFILK